MTEAEEQQLREMGADLATAARSPWEPRCVARAFASSRPGGLVLTMQQWIDLDSIQSPLLVHQPFESDEQLADSLAIFGKALHLLGPEEAARLTLGMEETVDEAFAMALQMRHPEAKGNARDDGFGTWLPVYGMLVAECGVDPNAALRLDVGRAFALIAVTRRNQGWDVAGIGYGQRDALQKEDTNG